MANAGGHYNQLYPSSYYWPNHYAPYPYYPPYTPPRDVCPGCGRCNRCDRVAHPHTDPYKSYVWGPVAGTSPKITVTWQSGNSTS